MVVKERHARLEGRPLNIARWGWWADGLIAGHGETAARLRSLCRPRIEPTRPTSSSASAPTGRAGRRRQDGPLRPKKPDNIDGAEGLRQQALKDRRISSFSFWSMTSRWSILEEGNDANVPVAVAGNRCPAAPSPLSAPTMSRSATGRRATCSRSLGAGKIVVVEGVPAARTNRDRLRGYQRASPNFPHSGARHRHRQLRAAGREARDGELLAEHAQIDPVLSANDSMALAHWQRRRSQADHDVIGVNGILDAARQIETGTILQASISNAQNGLLGGARRGASSQGRAGAKKLMLPAEIIDKANFKAWLCWSASALPESAAVVR